MNISDSLPIQFWPVGGQTFNESIFGFVQKKCFIQEFKCTDTIKLQVSNESDVTKAYSLKIVDKDGLTVTTLNFTKSFITGPSIILDFLNTTFPTGLTPWVNYNAGSGQANFNWSSPAVIVADGTAGSLRETAIFYQPRPDGYFLGWPPGNYQISLNGTNSSIGPDSGTMFAQGLGSNDGTTWTALGSSGSIPVAPFGFNLAFTIPAGQYYKYIGFLFNIGPPGNVINVSLNNVHLNVAPTNDTWAEYDLSFTSSTLSTPVCDAALKFYIQQNTVDIYKSDFIKFSASIAEDASWGTRLINYKSTKHFAGLNYPNTSAYFSLRIPCKFFTQRNSSQQSSIPLSNSKVINTSTYRKRQQLLEIVFMPDYMFNKLELILDHAVRGSLQIDGVEWTVDESFERSSPDQRFAFQGAKIWLSRKNYSVRNVI